MTRKDITDLYIWIRQNNHTASDEVVDYMYWTALKKFDTELGNKTEEEFLKIINGDKP